MGRHHHNAAYLSGEELAELDFAHLGRNVRIHSTCVLVNTQRMSIGDDVRIDPFCLLSAGEEGITIGSWCHIAAQVILVGAARITLGDFACVSHGSRILTASDDYAAGVLIGPNIPDAYRKVETRPVTMERHALIGVGTLLLPGAMLEEGATVGAMSLVKGRLEAWTVSAGCPARPIRQRDKAGVLEAERRLRAGTA